MSRKTEISYCYIVTLLQCYRLYYPRKVEWFSTISLRLIEVFTPNSVE